MAYKVYSCESCPTKVAVDARLKVRPIACPKCRGMLQTEGMAEEPEGTKIECPDCETIFYTETAPFKCAFCDHTFSKGYRYF